MTYGCNQDILMILGIINRIGCRYTDITAQTAKLVTLYFSYFITQAFFTGYRPAPVR